MRKKLNGLLMILAIALPAFAVTGCGDDNDSAAKNLGENIDNAVENTKEAFDNDGPAENFGEEVDEALEGDE